MKTVEIPLDEIRPAKEPVRQTRDEKKIKELAQSIAENGVLQPIKVRPVNDNGTTQYEIVFGARRWEAAGLIGLENIPAMIEQLDDADCVAEGLLENIQHEDMLDIDIARGAERYLHNHPLLNKNGYVKPGELEIIKIKKELAKKLGISYNHLNVYLSILTPKRRPVVDAMYEEDPNVKDVKTKSAYVQQAMPDEDIETQKAVAKKVVKEELGQRRARKVAQAVANAEDEDEKQAILESSYEDIIASPNYVKAKANVKRKQKKKKKRKQKEMEREVKLYLDAIQTFNAVLEDAILAAEYGKFSPEAARFTLRKHTTLQENIQKLENILGENSE